MGRMGRVYDTPRVVRPGADHGGTQLLGLNDRLINDRFLFAWRTATPPLRFPAFPTNFLMAYGSPV